MHCKKIDACQEFIRIYCLYVSFLLPLSLPRSSLNSETVPVSFISINITHKASGFVYSRLTEGRMGGIVHLGSEQVWL